MSTRTLWEFGFTRPGRVADLHAWFYWAWDMPKGCAALNIVREGGVSVLGIEVSRVVINA